jgi:hypothetical protein
MAVPITSRYWGGPVYTATDAAGTPQATMAIRRHTPSTAAVYQHVVTGVEDVEYLAWRFYGTSDSWWIIADANPLAFPLDLGPGDRIDVPTSAQPGQISRARSFP